MADVPTEPQSGEDADNEDADNPLLTPQEREAMRAARALRRRSEQLARDAARVTRPKDLTGRFPPAPR